MISVTVEGKSWVLVGTGVGLVGGTLAGALIGAATTEPSVETLGMSTIGGGIEGALIGGLSGLFLGLVVGGALSQSDQVIAPNEFGAPIVLQRFAEYPDGEPDFLRAIP
jgi:hypothetical protein